MEVTVWNRERGREGGRVVEKERERVCVWERITSTIHTHLYVYRGFSDDPLDLPVRYSREVNENELEESFSKNAGPPLTLWMCKCADLTTITNIIESCLYACIIIALLWGTVSSLPAAVQSIIKHYTIDRRSLSILSTVARGGSAPFY